MTPSNRILIFLEMETYPLCKKKKKSYYSASFGTDLSNTAAQDNQKGQQKPGEATGKHPGGRQAQLVGLGDVRTETPANSFQSL